jgi:hypothetical protein
MEQLRNIPEVDMKNLLKLVDWSAPRSKLEALDVTTHHYHNIGLDLSGFPTASFFSTPQSRQSCPPDKL